MATPSLSSDLKLRRSAVSFCRGLRARIALSGLASASRPLAAALVEAVSMKLSPPEGCQIQQIEELRERLLASSEPLQITDYGAGSPDASLSQEEMSRGRVLQNTVGKVCRVASRTQPTALVLFQVIRKMKPRTCFELGTCLGISGCYQASALKLNGVGKLITMEGADAFATVAAKNFAALQLDNVEIVRGRFQDTLPGLLAANPSVDYAFIDGHHDRAATLTYFEAFLPVLTEGAVVVFDDVRWSAGMTDAWMSIRSHERVCLSVDLESMGLVLIGRARPQRHFALKLKA